ncbi:hypothetical protein ID867_22500 [Streptomyces parvulus]|nr:hypothetical protein [Streptomyces parvulus]
MQVPLLVDLAHLFVFDQHGDRICPARVGCRTWRSDTAGHRPTGRVTRATMVAAPGAVKLIGASLGRGRRGPPEGTR